jgi:hypothetical protein
MVDNATPTGPPPPDAPPTAAQRIAEGTAWVVGILAVLFFGRAVLLVSPTARLTSLEQGELVGTILAAVIGGIVIRWLWVKLRKRGRVASPWVLLIATIALSINLVRDPALAPAGATVPIDTYLTVGAPYALATPAPDEAEQFKSALAGAGVSSSDVREVMNGTDTVGYYLVANLRASSSDEFMRGLERGFEENQGAEAHSEVIAGKDAVVGTGPQFTAIIWAEPPYGLVVYATDVETGKLIAASIIGAYK